jgi:hypothetical protein
MVTGLNKKNQLIQEQNELLMQELGKSKERERNFEQILFTAY